MICAIVLARLSIVRSDCSSVLVGYTPEAENTETCFTLRKRNGFRSLYAGGRKELR